MKKNNKKGFTLAELLIVVAIIAVLVAVAIPVFNAQLEKSRDAVDESNLRAAYGQAVADYLDNATLDTPTFTYGEQNFSAQLVSVAGVDGSVVKVTLTSGQKSRDNKISYTYIQDGSFANPSHS